ncbi:leucine-rich repeat-containing protein 1-like isoform X2 [Anneissia japonica]|uniref:leucine-rich repeat-containing protein 1-like isoform X2 n=1 Tax=Anneissia japonica TaxID=1529436 RepID=UPI001425904A|nr:leucine-rich repeat-containing protein 1-like isoform X2 [Anneissia japonica]
MDSLTPRKSKLKLRLDRDPIFNLKRLKLSGKELNDVPDELFDMIKIEFLDLSPERESCLHWRLPEVPCRINQLVNLRVLCLDTNELVFIPPEVGELHNLERLTLSNNLLTDLPSSIQNLQRLKSLHMANNFFEEIPREVFKLKRLEFLDASDNNISVIQEDIGLLVSLETLLLLYNSIKHIPDSLCNCTMLRNVWLGVNKLQSLPRNFGNLKRLDWAEYPHSANIEGNKLISPPIEVCRRGAAAIEEYFRNTEDMPEENDGMQLDSMRKSSEETQWSPRSDLPPPASNASEVSRS